MAKVGSRKMSVRDKVRKRANGSCERCGSKFHRNRNKSDATMHHRQPQRMGGVDSIANLILLCMRCHRDIHRREQFCAESGWIAWVVPELTPVRIRGKFWGLLLQNGDYLFLPESEAQTQIAHLLTFADAVRRMRDPFMQELAA